MGYVHDTQMSQFIPPSEFQHSAGTWTISEASNLMKSARTAADAAFTTLIPVPILSNAAGYKGAKLKSIDVCYSIGTAAADDFATVELEKITLPVDDTAVSGAAVSGATIDAGHDTAAERLAVDTDHVMTITLDDPAWFDDGDVYFLKLVVDAAAGTVFTFFGARVNYDIANLIMFPGFCQSSPSLSHRRFPPAWAIQARQRVPLRLRVRDRDTIF